MAYLSGTESDQQTPDDALVRKRLLVFAPRGFEDQEMACLLDVMGWTAYRPRASVVETTIAGFHDEVQGAFGTVYRPTLALGEAREEDFCAFAVPGGFHNRGFDEAYCDDVRRLARAFHAKGKPIATLCVGVLPVAESGVLEGGRATTYARSARHDNPGRLGELGCTYVDEPFVEWQGILSCSGPTESERVANRLLELLIGDEAREVAAKRAGLR